MGAGPWVGGAAMVIVAVMALLATVCAGAGAMLICALVNGSPCYTKRCCVVVIEPDANAVETPWTDAISISTAAMPKRFDRVMKLAM